MGDLRKVKQAAGALRVWQGWFAWIATAIYAAIVLSSLGGADFDVSRLIVAGDRYVDAGRVPGHIAVLPRSDGYDGQFYYRLALDPLPDHQTGSGITLDRPAYRNQRIGYPLIVHLASFGRAALVPWILLAVNLLGIFVMARTAIALTAKLDLPSWLAPAVLAWPGITVTLLHDTTEIVAAAWLLLAIEALVDKRMGRYVALAMLTVLTRETSAIFFGCVALTIASSGAGINQRQSLRRLVVGLFPLGCYALWRLFLAWHWRDAAGGVGSFDSDVGWPFAGFLQIVHDSVTLSRHLSPRPWPNMIRNGYVLITACGIFGAGVTAALRVPDAWRAGGVRRAIAAGWIGLALVLSTLTAAGPWVDPTAYFRAFTEYWIVSMLVIAGANARLPKLAIPFCALGWIACVMFIS